MDQLAPSFDVWSEGIYAQIEKEQATGQVDEYGHTVQVIDPVWMSKLTQPVVPAAFIVDASDDPLKYRILGGFDPISKLPGQAIVLEFLLVQIKSLKLPKESVATSFIELPLIEQRFKAAKWLEDNPTGTQKEFAAMVGVSPSYMSKKLRFKGLRNPSANSRKMSSDHLPQTGMQYTRRP
jgi:hypothetical protein